jgi:hypothetical protein
MRFKSALVAAAAAAGLIVSAAAPAAMASDNANVTGIYSGNYQCNGASNLASQAGFVNFHESGSQVTAIVHLKGAPPNNTVDIYGYSGFCTFDAFLGSVDTNSNGVGNGTFTYTTNTPGGQLFLVGFDIAPYTGFLFDSAAATP